ncbi:AEC family transporter [Curvivirga sp.]|uniref:AEC family transporter n=1 Tax=Curvivirga sp. TaxID=2856848 RepID=UPI003B5CEBE4
MALGLFAELAAVIIPVLILACIGYYLQKTNQAFDTKALTPLIINFGTPALVVYALLNAEIRLSDLGEMAAISLLMQALFGVIGYVMFKSLGWNIRTYLPVTMLPNNGNLGLPLCLFAFGEEGMALGVAYFAILPLSQFTIGQAIAAGHANLTKLFKNPMIWGLALSLALIQLDISLPQWVMNSLELTGSFTIPLMLVTLGISLAKLHVRSLPRAALIGFIRVFGGIAAGFFFVWLFDLQGVARGVVLIQAAMPSAVFNYLFANLYDNQPEEVAGVIVVSTVICFITLPFLLPWVF